MCRQEGWSNSKGATSSAHQRDQRPNILSITGHKPNSEVGMSGGANGPVRRLYTGASKRPSGKPRPRSGMVRPVAYVLSNNSKVHDDGLSPASDTAIDPHKKYNSTNNAVLSNQNAPTSRSAHSGVYSSAGSQVTIGRQINIATNAKKTRNTFETYLRARTAMRNKKRRPKSASQAPVVANQIQVDSGRSSREKSVLLEPNVNPLVPKLQLVKQYIESSNEHDRRTVLAEARPEKRLGQKVVQGKPPHDGAPDKAFSKGLRKHNAPQVSMPNSVYRSPNGEVKEYVPLSSRSRPSSRSNSARSEYVPLDSSRVDNDDRKCQGKAHKLFNLDYTDELVKDDIKNESVKDEIKDNVDVNIPGTTPGPEEMLCARCHTS